MSSTSLLFWLNPDLHTPICWGLPGVISLALIASPKSPTIKGLTHPIPLLPYLLFLHCRMSPSPPGSSLTHPVIPDIMIYDLILPWLILKVLRLPYVKTSFRGTAKIISCKVVGGTIKMTIMGGKTRHQTVSYPKNLVTSLVFCGV